ncbi:unnamed protein product [Boreogadus saida]
MLSELKKLKTPPAQPEQVEMICQHSLEKYRVALYGTLIPSSIDLLLQAHKLHMVLGPRSQQNPPTPFRENRNIEPYCFRCSRPGFTSRTCPSCKAETHMSSTSTKSQVRPAPAPPVTDHNDGYPRTEMEGRSADSPFSPRQTSREGGLFIEAILPPDAISVFMDDVPCPMADVDDDCSLETPIEGGTVMSVDTLQSTLMAKVAEASLEEEQRADMFSLLTQFDNMCDGLSPSMMLYGRELDTPLDLITQPSCDGVDEPGVPYPETLRASLQEAHDHARAALDDSHNRQKHYYDLRRRPATFAAHPVMAVQNDPEVLDNEYDDTQDDLPAADMNYDTPGVADSLPLDCDSVHHSTVMVSDNDLDSTGR